MLSPPPFAVAALYQSVCETAGDGRMFWTLMFFAVWGVVGLIATGFIAVAVHRSLKEDKRRMEQRFAQRRHAATRKPS